MAPVWVVDSGPADSGRLATMTVHQEPYRLRGEGLEPAIRTLSPGSGRVNLPAAGEVDVDGPRIVVVNTSASWGGTERTALLLARGFVERGARVRILWRHDEVGERVADAGLEGIRLPRGGELDPRLLSALTGHARGAAALLATKRREYLPAVLAARFAGTSAVLRLGLRHTPSAGLKSRVVFGMARRVIVNSPEVRDALLACPRVKPDRVTMIPNGVDTDAFAPGGDRYSVRREFGIHDNAPLIATVGALTGQKRHDLLIDALATLLRDDVHVVIAGEGDLRPVLEARIVEKGLADRIHLAGFRRDVRPVLAAADVFALPSENEGMAGALLEAMACGLPVVASAAPGVADCVEDGGNGRIVPVGDASALAGALAELVERDDRLQAMGERSRALAVERFPLDRMIDATLELLTR